MINLVRFSRSESFWRLVVAGTGGTYDYESLNLQSPQHSGLSVDWATFAPTAVTNLQFYTNTHCMLSYGDEDAGLNSFDTLARNLVMVGGVCGDLTSGVADLKSFHAVYRNSAAQSVLPGSRRGVSDQGGTVGYRIPQNRPLYLSAGGVAEGPWIFSAGGTLHSQRIKSQRDSDTTEGMTVGSVISRTKVWDDNYLEAVATLSESAQVAGQTVGLLGWIDVQAQNPRDSALMMERVDMKSSDATGSIMSFLSPEATPDPLYILQPSWGLGGAMVSMDHSDAGYWPGTSVPAVGLGLTTYIGNPPPPLGRFWVKAKGRVVRQGTFVDVRPIP